MKFFQRSTGDAPRGFLLVAGPCSAENEAQVIRTAEALAQTGCVNLFRAGIWKHRTRPNNFEGVGSMGLAWLQRARELSGLPMTVEVTLPKHVEECLRAKIDVLWIGARTTGNPILVGELASALKGTDIPVMVKNSLNPSVDLWIGAFERLASAGVTRMAGIHRGFSVYDHGPYRNDPGWKLATEMRALLPEIAMLCDPSHIAGRADLVPLITQEALSLEFDGLMLESHISPGEALSDADQQLTPAELKAMLLRLGR